MQSTGLASLINITYYALLYWRFTSASQKAARKRKWGTGLAWYFTLWSIFFHFTKKVLASTGLIYKRTLNETQENLSRLLPSLFLDSGEESFHIKTLLIFQHERETILFLRNGHLTYLEILISFSSNQWMGYWTPGEKQGTRKQFIQFNRKGLQLIIEISKRSTPIT